MTSVSCWRQIRSRTDIFTNPTPVMWTHFETIHETMQPTYQSMYFPGQGLLLAAAERLFGNPWFGMLLASAAFCAALCWMLQAWLPANWALLGGIIAVLRLGLFSCWTNSYLSAGSLAGLGGVLVLGALPRLMRTGRLRHGLLMGAGIALLILTRPYEGLLLCLPVAAVLGRWAWKGKNRSPAAILARRAAMPMLLVMGALAWLGYYDYRAFGNPLTLPYTVNRNTYATAPYYVWQKPRSEPAYRHQEMRTFYGKEKGEMGEYLKIHSLRGFLPHSLGKVGFFFLFYGGTVLFLPLLMLRRVFLDRRIRFLIVCVLVLAAGMSIEIFLLPHYVAPFVGAFYVIGLQAMRHLRLWKPEGKPVGRALVCYAVIVTVAMGGGTPLRSAAAPRQRRVAPQQLVTVLVRTGTLRRRARADRGQTGGHVWPATGAGSLRLLA